MGQGIADQIGQQLLQTFTIAFQRTCNLQIRLNSRVREALSNLVTNAFEHASDKDDVTIDLSDDEKTVKIAV